MRIAVLGGGHGSYAAAAELTEKGHEVAWWRRDRAAADELARCGRIVVRDFRGERAIPLPRLASDLADAVRGAELVVIPLPATTHDDLAAALAPHLRDGQVVFMPPGTFGSLVFARAVQAAGTGAQPVFAEAGTLPYLVRKHAVDRIVVSGYATRLPTGVFPRAAAPHAFAVLKRAYAAVEDAGDALSGALMNAGPIIHPPLILLNAGPLEHFPAWDIHNEGTQPSIRRVTDALDAERIGLREALGYGAPHFPLADHYALDGDEWMYGRGGHERLVDSGDWREKIDLRAHRYMIEDTRLGLALLASVGRMLGRATPLVSGLLAIGGTIAGRDFYAEGRTLESVGLGGIPVRELQALLHVGFAP
jgi:opine dehydrogenase